ncbi:ArnT family glycosyltransferase [uncultured Sphingomonas sp.]|uniref:ArnT family glycosyltransferase n=1 Tax=uncultured Sphingomonas sp. TaxID=158754 RepID=UPI0035CB876F
MRERMSPWQRGRVPLILLALAVATRVWDVGNPIVHVDEQYYLLVGDRMLRGALPYVDIWDRKPIGLFAIYAAIRLLPGNGIVAYQLVALLFAAATAWVVERMARKVGGSRGAALAAGAAYLVWLPLLSGRAGQSPVFYDLFVTLSALLSLRLPELAGERRVGAIVGNGAIVCLLAGLAIQTKYTPAVEGAYFGVVHLVYLRRARARWRVTGAAAMAWIVLGLAPTALVVAIYWAKGPAVFAAFWFANFSSILLRHGYPASKIAMRLLGTWAQLSPLAIAAGVALYAGPRGGVRGIAFGWLAAALVGYAMIGAFFDHYALPLAAPLCVAAAPTFSRYRRAMIVALAAGCAVFAVKLALRTDDRAAIHAVARTMAANDHGRCPYVFAGDSILYHLAQACLPTAYAFPSTLAYAPEQGATGIDEAGEVARIMTAAPPVVVTLDHPLADWNVRSLTVMRAALARDYRLVQIAPREGGHMLVYRRRTHPG